VATSARLWIAAAAATVVAAAWQWRTGPSYPYRVRVALGGVELGVTFPHSHVLPSAARVAVPAVPAGATGTIFWRESPSAQPFAELPMRLAAGDLVAELPAQPAGGKVAYYVELRSAAGSARIPRQPGGAVVVRFRGPIPAPLLITHIVVMFIAMLLGVRAGLAALWEGDRYRLLTWLALAAISVGGGILGPITQKDAFGAYWTGIPFGWDLTDNKTLVAWIGWALAGVAAARRWRGARWVIAAALVVMLAAFLVPHSLLGT